MRCQSYPRKRRDAALALKIRRSTASWRGWRHPMRKFIPRLSRCARSGSRTLQCLAVCKLPSRSRGAGDVGAARRRVRALIRSRCSPRDAARPLSARLRAGRPWAAHSEDVPRSGDGNAALARGGRPVVRARRAARLAEEGLLSRGVPHGRSQTNGQTGLGLV